MGSSAFSYALAPLAACTGVGWGGVEGLREGGMTARGAGLGGKAIPNQQTHCLPHSQAWGASATLPRAPQPLHPPPHLDDDVRHAVADSRRCGGVPLLHLLSQLHVGSLRGDGGARHRWVGVRGTVPGDQTRLAVGRMWSIQHRASAPSAAAPRPLLLALVSYSSASWVRPCRPASM